MIRPGKSLAISTLIFENLWKDFANQSINFYLIFVCKKIPNNSHTSICYLPWPWTWWREGMKGTWRKAWKGRGVKVFHFSFLVSTYLFFGSHNEGIGYSYYQCQSRPTTLSRKNLCITSNCQLLSVWFFASFWPSTLLKKIRPFGHLVTTPLVHFSFDRTDRNNFFYFFFFFLLSIK